MVLLVDLLAVSWYRRPPLVAASSGISGWHQLTILRWVLVLAGLLGIGLALAQARYRAPAVPVTLAVVLTLLGLVSTIALIVRVVVATPASTVDARTGGYVGLAATAGLLAAGLASLRREGILERDGPREIPTLSI